MIALLRCCVVAGAATTLLALSCPAAAQEPLVPKELQPVVNRGVDYLKRIQNNGNWPHAQKGATPLAAWTLLECGTSPNDPIIQKAADNIRTMAFTTTKTYDLALMVMFLDRLGDPEDEALLEALALQLMAGQNQSLGWTYDCPALPEKVAQRVRDHIAKVKAAGPRQLPEKPADKAPRDPKQVDREIMQAAEASSRQAAPPGMGNQSDNSNTQFAMLALWVARRHGMPVDAALWRVDQRFRSTQLRSGGWGYVPSTVSKSVKDDSLLPPSRKPTASMTAVGMISLVLGNAVAPPKNQVNLGTDPAVKAGLYVLSVSIGEPDQPPESLKLPPTTRSYYFLWTLERMAVIYDLKTIAGKDWYHWGAEVIKANQQADGSWQGEYGTGGCDTCFALLFLVKANVARDLTVKVKDKVKDPGKVPADLFDLIGRDVQPGVDMKKPPKNAPQPHVEPSRPEERPIWRAPSTGDRRVVRPYSAVHRP